LNCSGLSGFGSCLRGMLLAILIVGDVANKADECDCQKNRYRCPSEWGACCPKLIFCILSLLGIVTVAGQELRHCDGVGLECSDLSGDLATVRLNQFECNPSFPVTCRSREVVVNASDQDQLNSPVRRRVPQGIRDLRWGEFWFNNAVDVLSREDGKNNLIRCVWRITHPSLHHIWRYIANDMKSHFHSHILGGGMAAICQANANRSGYLLVGDFQRSGNACFDTDPWSLRGNEVRSVDLIADYCRDESGKRYYSGGYQSPERSFSPRYLLLLPTLLMSVLGFVLLKKRTENDSNLGIVMMLSGWFIWSVAFGILVFRIILNQI